MKRVEAKKSLEINAALNIIKQCCAILFPLITFPYISRKLGSEGYGTYSFSWSFVSYFVMFAALGTHTYAVREGARIRDNKQKLEIFTSEVFTINLLSSTVALALLFGISFISPKLNGYIVYIVIESFAIVLSLFGRDWLNSIYEDYFYITARYITIQFLALIAMFFFVKNNNHVWIYCILAILASFGGNIPNVLYTRRYAKLTITREMRFKQHIIPLLTLFANTIAMMVFVNSDIIMLGFYYNDEIVGVYSLSSKVYSMIKQMLNAIVIVALPRVTSVIDKNEVEYGRLLRTIFNYLTIILIPVSVGLFMISDSVIMLAGGHEYISGDPAMKVLSISIIFAMVGSFMMNCVLIANRKDTKCFTSTMIAALSNIVLNLLLLRRIGILGAAITTLIAELINAILMTYYSKQIVKEKIIDFKNLLQCLIGGVGVFIVCYLVKISIDNFVLRSIIAICGSLIVYLVFMLAIKNEYFMSFLKPIIVRVNNIIIRRKK